MKFILHAKHWQIFLFVFLIPFSMIIGGYYYFKETFNMSFLLYMIALGIALAQISLYAWLWSVGSNLACNAESEKKRIGLFKALLSIPTVTLILIFVFGLVFPFLFDFGKPTNATVLLTFFGSIMFIVVPVQFVFVVSAVYCVFFVARTIKQCETKQKAVFEDFYSEFILILFLPLGIWFLQPKINKLI